MSLLERIKNLENKIDISNDYINKELWEDIYNKIKEFVEEKSVPLYRPKSHFGLLLCLCISTEDPWKQNRIRFFSPFLHSPECETTSLPFADCISSLGGFDDCGLTWIPPAGSSVGIIFENGNIYSPFYIGTTWHRNRDPDSDSSGNNNAGGHNWGVPIPEYINIHQGHRNGYVLGPNDGSQVLPPWNTENYNGIDLDSSVDFDINPLAQKNTTYPNIYGFKTPQKHMVKMVDGDYNCNHKNKRLEILSSCGNWMIFKDDHLHNIQISSANINCNDKDTVDCIGGEYPPNLENPSTIPYIKQLPETKPWIGRGTPQSTVKDTNGNLIGSVCTLPQSGIQLLSISGHSFCMDDSVDEPSGTPEWERSMNSFDFGCNNKFIGKTFWASATGHRIEMNDEESNTNVRSENNYIRIISACGNRLELNDHSVDENNAGTNRGIVLESTSKHLIEMRDGEKFTQSSPRKQGGEPTNQAKQAYVRIRSGYGLEINLNDDASQQNTQAQYIRLFCPQIDNKTRGPHEIRMQEVAEGPGQILIKSGGNFACDTYDEHMTVVGDINKNPSDKLTLVTKNNLVYSKGYYINIADTHIFSANNFIILGAGQDCPIPNTDKKGPCLWPVLVLKEGVIAASDRVFASASPDATCLSMFQMLPFVECPTSIPQQNTTTQQGHTVVTV